MVKNKIIAYIIMRDDSKKLTVIIFIKLYYVYRGVDPPDLTRTNQPSCSKVYSGYLVVIGCNSYLRIRM